jgi:hypothetical protein
MPDFLVSLYGIIAQESNPPIYRTLLSPVRAFLNFVMIPYVVWMDFSVSDLKFNYIGPRTIKLKRAPLMYIGD